MKKLVYKNNTYYITDDIQDIKGKTHIIKYIASVDNMPHKYFSEYIVIYGRSTCPYCIKSIDLLKKNPLLLFIEIDNEPFNLFNKSNLLKILNNDIKKHSTVPIIFNKGIFIGGFNDAEIYFK